MGLLNGVGVGLLQTEFHQDFAFLQLLYQRVIAVHLGRQDGALLENRPGFLGVVPEAVLADLEFDFLQAVFLGRQVKDSLSVVRISCEAP
jgi:hypothetical protein